MLHYDKACIFEGIDVSKTRTLKEYYLLLLVFLDKGIKFQSDVYNGCHDV